MKEGGAQATGRKIANQIVGNHLMGKAMLTNNGNSRVFIDPETKFSIWVPDGWLIDNSGQQDTKVILFHPLSENSFRANVNIVVQSLAPLTPEEYVTLSRLQLKQLTGFVKLPVDEPETGNPANHVFEWAVSHTPVPVKARQRVVFEQKKAFVITATAFLGQFESHRAEFEGILNSLHSEENR